MMINVTYCMYVLLVFFCISSELDKLWFGLVQQVYLMKLMERWPFVVKLLLFIQSLAIFPWYCCKEIDQLSRTIVPVPLHLNCAILQTANLIILLTHLHTLLIAVLFDLIVSGTTNIWHLWIVVCKKSFRTTNGRYFTSDAWAHMVMVLFLFVNGVCIIQH
jgi:hypothetical protein